MKKRENTHSLNVLITEAETEKLVRLAKHFGTTQYGVIERACEYLPQIEKIKFTQPLNRTGNSQKWTHKHFLFDQNFFDALEKYATENFRELANTVRFLINGCYEVVFGKYGQV